MRTSHITKCVILIGSLFLSWSWSFAVDCTNTCKEIYYWKGATGTCRRGVSKLYCRSGDVGGLTVAPPAPGGTCQDDTGKGWVQNCDNNCVLACTGGVLPTETSMGATNCTNWKEFTDTDCIQGTPGGGGDIDP